MQTGMACLTRDASNVDNVRFWHKADLLTELKVRYEREADSFALDYIIFLAWFKITTSGGFCKKNVW